MSESYGQWERAPGPVGFVTLKMSVFCQHCAAPVVVNGPAQHVVCDACHGRTQIDALPVVLQSVAANMRTLGLIGTNRGENGQAFSSYNMQYYGVPSPACNNCDGLLPIVRWMDYVGATCMLPCDACGEAIPTYPAPAWLRTQIPTALQVFGGEAPFREAHPGTTLNVAQEESQPIVMNCPACSAGLTITKEMERTVSCQYCRASVFLPDALWKRLHPRKQMVRWTLTYSGELWTADRVAQAALATERIQKERRFNRQISIVLLSMLAAIIAVLLVVVVLTQGDTRCDFMGLRMRCVWEPEPPLVREGLIPVDVMVGVQRRVAQIPRSVPPPSPEPIPQSQPPARPATARPRRVAPSAPSPSVTTKPAPKSTGACGCAHEDLLCRMRCSQRR